MAADFVKLREEIRANIKPNNRQEITGAVAQGVLVDMVDVIEEAIEERESGTSGIVLDGEVKPQYTPDSNGIIHLPPYPSQVTWDNISGKPSWIGSSKPTYGFTELTTHPTTLSGYGITDAQEAITSTNKLDYSLIANTPTIPTELSQLAEDAEHRLVTDTEKASWSGKYTKPQGGIPISDLTPSVQESLGKADTAIQEIPDNATLTIQTSETNSVLYNGKEARVITIPWALSMLTADETHRLTTDTEKAKWNSMTPLTDFNAHVNNNDRHLTAIQKKILEFFGYDEANHALYLVDSTKDGKKLSFYTYGEFTAGGVGSDSGGGGDVMGIKFGTDTIINSTEGVLYVENIPMGVVNGLADALSAKQGTITDLATIRSNASLGAEAYGLLGSDGAVIAAAEGQTRKFLETHKADKAIHLTAEEHEEIRRWGSVGVILEGDARLTNARNASDVYAWAKKSNLSTAINYDLTLGTSIPVDDDYYISQYVGGGSSTTTYHRRPHSALFSYIKGKLPAWSTANSLTAANVPSLDASKITSGTFADARIASAAAWNAKWDYNEATIKAVKVTNAGYADSSGYATSSGSAGNSDTVDGYHASAFARTAAHNDLIAAGNEFTFASSGYNGAIHINYRTSGGTNGNITDYYFDNGKGGVLWMLSTVASNASLGATANSWGNHASQGYAKQTTIDNDSCAIAAGVADCKVAIETIERVMSAAEVRTRRAIEEHKGDEERHVTFDERVVLALFEPIYSGNRMTGIRIKGNLQASGEIVAGA